MLTINTITDTATYTDINTPSQTALDPTTVDQDFLSPLLDFLIAAYQSLPCETKTDVEFILYPCTNTSTTIDREEQ